MNYIQHLSAFFKQMESDNRMSPFHVSLYMALFYRWNRSRFENPITICRNEILSMSKIGSVNTYTKCLKELHKWKYIRYEPSHSPLKGSRVYLFPFQSITDEEHLQPCGEKEFDNPQQHLNESKPEKMETHQTPSKTRTPKRTSGKKTPGTPERRRTEIPPPPKHVNIYFMEKGFESIEAERFFNYYDAIGWKVGGKTRMTNWKAAARNWMINARKYAPTLHKQINNTPNQTENNHGKAYDEPL